MKEETRLAKIAKAKRLETLLTPLLGQIQIFNGVRYALGIHEGKYYIASEDGIIYSVIINEVTGTILPKAELTQKPIHHGYIQCMNTVAHRLVYYAFHPNEPRRFYANDEDKKGKTYHIDHIDNNKGNNHIDNLRRLTPKQNTARIATVKKIDAYKVEVNGLLTYVGTYDNQTDAAKVLLLRPSDISRIINGYSKTAYGYTFKISQ